MAAMQTTATLFHNGSIYLSQRDGSGESSGSHLGQALLTQGSKILKVGTHHEVTQHAKTLQQDGVTVTEVDLHDHFLMPAFIDSHVHLSMQGESLEKVDLEGCKSLAEIQQRIRDEIGRRGLGKGDKIQVKRFVMPMLGGAAPHRSMLDACSDDGEVAVFVESRDLHSSWLSSAALAMLKIDATTPTPAGGTIHRDSQNDASPTGFLEEAAHVALVWNNLPKLYTTAQRKQTIRNGIDSWLRQGVGSIVDMAMTEDTLALLKQIADEGQMSIRIACHWLIERKDDEADNLAQVRRAKEVQRELQSQGYSPWLRIAGIKIISDGVIDGCTAALHEPYFNGNNAEPIWPLSKLKPVVRLADELELQCAVHAIGDRAVDVGLDALEYAVDTNGPRVDRRHRIEHLELTKADSVPRLKKLGVTASVQAVHASPAVQDNWKNMLGNDDRCGRAYAYGDFLSQGVLVALGTDAPTAHNSALQNVYLATTRLAPEPHHAHLPPTTSEYALTLLDALNAATASGAIAEKQEHVKGRLQEGLQADFVVLSVDVVREGGGQSLLKARVAETWVGGRKVFSAET